MAQPQTYLLTSPDASEALGVAMSSGDLIKGLQRANANLIIPTPEHFAWWYPGRASGSTCIWLGAPSEPGSVKICALTLGTIPEFTQLAPDGQIICRGWRSIMERVIVCKAATRSAPERIFRVDLTYAGRDPFCPKCRRTNLRNRAVAASGLCADHEQARRLSAIRERYKSNMDALNRRFR